MKRTLLVLFVVGCGAAFAAEPDMTLSADAMGSFKTGMGVDVLERTAHQKLPYNPYVNHGCSVITTQGLEPWGVSFMIEQKKLARINVDFFGSDPRPLTIKTAEGIGLASTEEDVMKAYGARVRMVPNQLDPTWHTLFVDSPDRTHGMVFETDGKTVKSLRIGEYPAIESQTGCG